MSAVSVKRSILYNQKSVFTQLLKTCLTGLIRGWKHAQHRFSTRLAATLQNTFHFFVVRFTPAFEIIIMRRDFLFST